VLSKFFAICVPVPVVDQEEAAVELVFLDLQEQVVAQDQAEDLEARLLDYIYQ
jgi:hypothetical protein